MRPRFGDQTRPYKAAWYGRWWANCEEDSSKEKIYALVPTTSQLQQVASSTGGAVEGWKSIGTRLLSF